jgi:sugar/nucleoside kinase (ribokinase family)
VSGSGLLVAGSIALDRLDGPFGSVSDELGGSALYFSLAASLLGPVRIVAPVGKDAVEAVKDVLGDRQVDLSGLSVFDSPTYRWQARQVDGRNQDLGSRDNIYDSWRPQLPEGFDGWVFVGSMRPDRQVEAAEQASGAMLLAADAMRSYLVAAPRQAQRLLQICGWFFCNHEEFEALGGNRRDPEVCRSEWGLEGLVVKSGPEGVAAYTSAGRVAVPALKRRPLIDTTGAGDALAGGMLGRWLETGGRPDGLGDALCWGVACASIAIEEIGVRSLVAATREEVAERAGEVAALSR